MSAILFVDDHHALRTVFAETLRFAGHTVWEAATLADAEHLTDHYSGAIDVLIVEAVLSTTNGLDFARRLRAAFQCMQVLFVSEESGKALSAEGLLPKGARFLRKPFQAEDLARHVRALAPSARQPSEAA